MNKLLSLANFQDVFVVFATKHLIGVYFSNVTVINHSSGKLAATAVGNKAARADFKNS